MKWVYLATAQDQIEAELWCGILAEEGIKAIVRPGDATGFLGVTLVPCRVVVPEDEFEAAKDSYERLIQHKTGESQPSQ